MLTRLISFWNAVRQLSGDDAYDRYLAHHARHHPHEPVLDRKTFFQRWQDGKWDGIKRCC